MKKKYLSPSYGCRARFLWRDGESAKTGRLVTLRGDRIALCGEKDTPFGITCAPARREQKSPFSRILFRGEDRHTVRENSRRWAEVGLIGKFAVEDRGDLRPGDCVCAGASGRAVRAAGCTPFYVMRRLDGAHVLVFAR